MYNKSSGAIIYKLLVSSAVCVYSVLVPVSWYQFTCTCQLVPATGTRNRSVWHGLYRQNSLDHCGKGGAIHSSCQYTLYAYQCVWWAYEGPSNGAIWVRTWGVEWRKREMEERKWRRKERKEVVRDRTEWKVSTVSYILNLVLHSWCHSRVNFVTFPIW